ncbi:MAG: TolC family protein [Pirellulales bacterium]
MNRSAKCLNAGHKHVAVSIALILGFMLVIPSCGIPKLQQAEPGAPTPETFNGSTSCDNSTQLYWAELFNDPQLAGLIDEAIVGNQELKILYQEVMVANYEIMARRGEYLPKVFFRSGAGLEKPSRFTPEGAVEDQLLGAPGKPFPEPLPDFLVATNVTWELDIWRKLRNARDAASLRYLGTEDGRNYVVTRLVAEVADSYYELLALDNRLATLDRMIEIQDQSLSTAEAMKQAGRETELAVQRFQAEVRKNQSRRSIIQQDIVEVENRINTLLGRYPQHIERNSANFVDLHLHALSVGVPSQLLQNRADIRQAERELAAAGLDVRIARARFFPTVGIGAGVGLRAFNTRYLLSTPESVMYNVTGDLIAPLINKAEIRADYLTANAIQLQKVYDYQRIVINAFTEVINRISKVQNYGQSIELQKQQLESLEASVSNATSLFQNARAEYMEVLLAQRDLLEGRMVLIETKQQQLSAIVNAYQALGGGAVTGASLGGGMMPATSGKGTFLDQPQLVLPNKEELPAPEPPKSTEPEAARPSAPLKMPDPGDSSSIHDGRIRKLPAVQPASAVDSPASFAH